MAELMVSQSELETHIATLRVDILNQLHEQIHQRDAKDMDMERRVEEAERLCADLQQQNKQLSGCMQDCVGAALRSGSQIGIHTVLILSDRLLTYCKLLQINLTRQRRSCKPSMSTVRFQ